MNELNDMKVISGNGLKSNVAVAVGRQLILIRIHHSRDKLQRLDPSAKIIFKRFSLLKQQT
jgi:hypothetical protein